MQPKIGIERMFVFDTSALIDMKHWYPMDVFKEIWRKMDLMARNGEIVAPVEVLNEIEKKDDVLKEWCRAHRNMFVDVDDGMVMAFEKVKDEYDENYWETNINQEYWADPWVIALALDIEIIVEGRKEHPVIVTSENKTKANRIPTIAKRFGLKSLNVPEFMKEIGGESG